MKLFICGYKHFTDYSFFSCRLKIFIDQNKITELICLNNDCLFNRMVEKYCLENELKLTKTNCYLTEEPNNSLFFLLRIIVTNIDCFRTIKQYGIPCNIIYID